MQLVGGTERFQRQRDTVYTGKRPDRSSGTRRANIGTNIGGVLPTVTECNF